MCITHLLHLTYLISMEAMVMVVHYSAMMDAEDELSTYSMAVAQLNYSSSIDFWVANTAVMPTLAPLALDIISAPALQAYVERVFSVCGDLTTCKRNRMSKNLYTRVSEDKKQVLLSTCSYSSCLFC